MNWIVIGEKTGLIQLVSRNRVTGMLPKGTFLTIEEGESRFVLRVEASGQQEPYSPSPLVVDMDLSPLVQDRVCKNMLGAQRVYSFGTRVDGLIDYIRPQSIARLSNQAEIDAAMGVVDPGPKVFAATVQYEQNQVLKDGNGKPITVSMPIDMFFHQMLICGKTGSGKTVSIKYLSQYFVEEFEGAVLAINVKDVDLLKMDRPSMAQSQDTETEWNTLGKKPHGVENYTIYYPANSPISSNRGVTSEVCKGITLDVTKIDPEALTGLLQNISDVGAMNFPNIFRYWQEEQRRKNESKGFRFTRFVEYFRRGEEDGCVFQTLNPRGDQSELKLHRGTFDNILRNLDVAIEFFDNEGSSVIDETDILQRGKMSVIDVAGKNGIQFGSIILRDLLHKIVAAKSEQRSTTPILLVIDEVHQFYNTNASYEALGDLDTICRTGRSQKIGVIFSSQNPQDIPRGLSSVINTKIFFKSDISQAKSTGVSISLQEMESLKKGYAVASIHDLSQLRVLKFPLAFAGVH